MPDQPEEFENPSQDLQSGADAAQSAASNAPRAVQYTGKAVQFAGKGVELAGQGLRALAPIPVVGWVAGGIGIGLMGAGKGMQAAGKGMAKGAQAAGKIKSTLGPAGQLGPLKGLASPGGLAKFIPGPVGLAMRIKDLLSKLPVIGGLIKNLDSINKKVLGAIAAGVGYLFYLLLQLLGKLIGLILSLSAGAAVGAIIGFMIGGPAGAVIGAAIGAYLGPKIAAIASKTFGAAKSVTSTATSVPGSITGGITSGISGAVSGVTSAISGAFSAVTGTVGGFLGGIGSAVGGIGSTLGGILNAAAGAVTTTASASVLVTVGTVAATGTFLVTMDEPGTHFTFDADNPSAASSQNQYFKVTKTANKTALSNSLTEQTQEITFTITLTTTRNLSGVTVVDAISIQGPINFNLTINNDKDGKAISPIDCPKIISAGQSCTRSFTIAVDAKFNNSTITNMVSATAIPEGQGLQSSTAIAVVTVGTPPTLCPKGWPIESRITQGPEGHFQFNGQAFGHGDLGYEALDMGAPLGNNVYATVNGIVHIIPLEAGPNGTRPNTDQRIQLKTSCGLLGTVNFWHLQSLNVVEGELVTAGKLIGTSGVMGTGPHIHYQFNEQRNRLFLIQTPYIPPPDLPSRDCLDAACNTSTTSTYGPPR